MSHSRFYHPKEDTMTKLIKSIAAVLHVETEHQEYRFSRGMGPRPAPGLRHK
jgi:hypothetical protein